jgi:hypothetical protein
MAQYRAHQDGREYWVYHGSHRHQQCNSFKQAVELALELNELKNKNLKDLADG